MAALHYIDVISRPVKCGFPLNSISVMYFTGKKIMVENEHFVIMDHFCLHAGRSSVEYKSFNAPCDQSELIKQRSTSSYFKANPNKLITVFLN